MASAGSAVLFVAHPDDCVIFGYPFIHNHPEFSWDIFYLTYTSKADRAKEVRAFWDKRNIKTFFLGCLDDYRYVERGELGFDGKEAREKIQYLSQGYKLILTHNVDGDYGHLHHKFVHESIKDIAIPQIYFASTFNLNYECTCPDYGLEDLPLHREVIEGFQDRLTGRYIVTDSARKYVWPESTTASNGNTQKIQQV